LGFFDKVDYLGECSVFANFCSFEFENPSFVDGGSDNFSSDVFLYGDALAS
jgi:hypothetical protein